MSGGARVGETWHHVVDVANGEKEPLGPQNNTRRDRRRPTSRVPFLGALSSAPSRYRKSCCATPAESAALVVNGDHTLKHPRMNSFWFVRLRLSHVIIRDVRASHVNNSIVTCN